MPGSIRCGFVIGLSVACSMPLQAAGLKLSLASPGPPYGSGDTVIVTLSMVDLGTKSNEVAGFQAFLTFDSLDLSLLAGTYPPEPFGLPLIPIIQAIGEDIDLAAGIDVFSGQMPTSEQAEIATLFFEALDDLCLPEIGYRETTGPQTLLTDAHGVPVPGLELISIEIVDCNANQIEDACDIADGTSRDCNFNTVPDECETMSCPADLTGPEGVPDRIVGINDFQFLLAHWGSDGCADFSSTIPNVPDGIVGINDFLDLLAAWGPCP